MKKEKKKVRFHLVVMTREECTVEKEVPVDTTNDELDKMLEQVYDATDGPDFAPDVDYWEKGDCRWEIIEKG